ncbi:MAG: hypothetical protein ACYC09_14700 [Bacteroidota bacterium]
MRKKFIISHAVIFVFSLLVLVGCKKDETSPTSNTNTVNEPANLTLEQAIAEISIAQDGADPRGLYYINTPFVTFKTNDTTTGLQYKSETKNGGSGTIKVEGASAIEGTWTSTNVNVTVDLVLTVTTNGVPEDVQFAPTADDLKGLNGSNSGTWKVIGDKMVMNTNGSTEPADTSNFGTTSKGLFRAIEFGNLTVFQILKK